LEYNVYAGRAYVYYGGSSMNNIPDVIMTGVALGDRFGTSVSFAGDVNKDGYSDVIVGAPGYNSSTGRAYIYYGGAVMNNVADVILTGEAINNHFGISVSKAGDVNGDGYFDVIAGAYGYISNTGRAYVYYGGAAMNNVADVIMTGEGINNWFGWSVSASGDVNGDGYADVIAGAINYNSVTGRSYVYYGSPAMNNTPDLIMTGQTAGDFFGISSTSAGDVNGDGYSDIIIGAYGYNSNRGRAYLYTNVVTGDDISDITLTGETVYSDFGLVVASAGDVNGDGYSDIIVGAPIYNTSTGRAYIYFGGPLMNNVPDVVFTGEITYDYFGFSVSGAGDVNGDGYADVIIGALENSGNGKAYIFYGGSIMNNVPDVIMHGEFPSDYFGHSVAGAGDVNSDGFQDVIVGANEYNSNKGRSYIFYGGASMNNVADVTMTGEFAGDQFGNSVSGAGDLNGDGYSDVIVGAPYYAAISGRTYIFYGGSSMNNVADVTMTGFGSGYFGISVSGCGDVNGDGYPDVIIGGEKDDNGRAEIFYGGPSMNNVTDITLTGLSSTEDFANSVSGCGDVNGDGYQDVIVGASLKTLGSGGHAYIYYGGPSMKNIPDVTMTTMFPDHTGFGSSVSGAGDVNGDGYRDVIVGADGYDSLKGQAFIYMSSPPHPVVTLNLGIFIQGFYNPSTNIQTADTVRVYLRSSYPQYVLVDSAKGVVSKTGMITLRFRNTSPGSYYIVVKHRNSIETWSKAGGQFLQTGTNNYAMFDLASKAFGNNMKQVDSVPIRFAMYSGDVNQEGHVNLADLILIYNDAAIFATGYKKTDVTGDNRTDLLDLIITYNNSLNFVHLIRP
ncbi:MAG: FG-GAP-like repeat-containing protein, partial [Ignavibacteria bacterium]